MAIKSRALHPSTSPRVLPAIVSSSLHGALGVLGVRQPSQIGWPLPASAAVQKFRRLSRWSIVSSICSSWIAKICAKSRLPPGANRWPTFLRKAPENLRLSDELRGSKDKLLRVAKEFAVRSLRRGRRCRRWWVVQTCVALISPHRSGSRRRSISGGARRRGCKGSPRW